MTKLELYELKEKLVGLNIDFPQSATRSELEALLSQPKVETTDEVEDTNEEVEETKEEEKQESIEDKTIKVASRVAEATEDGLAKPLAVSEKEEPMARKKRHDRTTPVEEPDVVSKKYIVVGNIKGMAKGMPFVSSESQIKQMLEVGAIKEI